MALLADGVSALLIDGAHRGREGGVAVPAVDDRPAVDRHDVALLEHPRPGDAVHDDLVRRGADHGRVPVVAEEVRLGSPPVEHFAPDAIELARREIAAVAMRWCMVRQLPASEQIIQDRARQSGRARVGSFSPATR